jgi:ketosteroid isomerase-like protein
VPIADSPKGVSVVNEFNAAINDRDLDRLAALMTSDHQFIDTEGSTVAGKAACVAAWQSFFDSFPDYRDVFEDIHSEGDRVVAIGHSLCSFSPLAGPAEWHAVVRDRLIAQWSVVAP